MAVYHFKTTGYQLDEIQAGLEKGLNALGGVTQILDGRQKLLFKPNFVAPSTPELAVATNPVFILAVLDFFKAYGCDGAIGESPGFGSVAGAVESLGLKEELARRQVPYFDFKKVRSFNTLNPRFPRLTIAKEIQDYDGLVNLPKLKTHCQAHFSGAVKNLYGCVPGKRKALRHMQARGDERAFAQMIYDNHLEAGAFLHIGDAIESLHVRGPSGGVPFPMGSGLIAQKAPELDLAFCGLINLDPLVTEQFQFSGLPQDQRVLGEPLVPCTQFQHSPKIPIFFNPYRIAKSVARNLFLQAKQGFS
ncbi:MAG: hypothetical protein A2527_12210 [Candidatus Lambdaproteobacteria bacterium RIFOXYD2_FULL_50_16]|uniref:DUF362 domain-containing protein n=1 Tax=Candidatus Lambdaproteobacteria bacterium RIFOXYD2_FULL_50_16 TaxID=1817772 RepID=A0A1F6GD83_9PROT|nr:MAG: hypothetical protein A2527_12210 [Candidatus Lambdaproteobacteria bacterium RIFOXYD2_FULL_50_16]